MCAFADIPLSVGILDPRASPTQLNAVEFLWDPAKRASAFIQVSKHVWRVACWLAKVASRWRQVAEEGQRMNGPRLGSLRQGLGMVWS